jgi:hypothetical protein
MERKKVREDAKSKAVRYASDYISGFVEGLEQKWREDKKRELQNCYNALAEVALAYPSTVSLIATKILEHQLIQSAISEGATEQLTPIEVKASEK